MSFVAVFNQVLPLSDFDPPTVDFRALALERFPGCHLARDRTDRPVLLIRATAVGMTSQPPALVLENIRVDNHMRCEVQRVDGGYVRGDFTVIRCTSTDLEVQELFLQILESTLATLGPDASEGNLLQFLDNLAELFRALEREPGSLVMALWSELFILTQACDPAIMLRAWHSDATELFDFSSGRQRLEVKSSANRSRRHHISLDQAYPPAGVEVLIASVFVEPGVDGPSLRELWDAARQAAGAESGLSLKIDTLCLYSLGRTWLVARDRRFDAARARESLAFYSVDEIPRVGRLQPLGVSDVRFCSDLGQARPIGCDQLEAMGGLFEAARLRR